MLQNLLSAAVVIGALMVKFKLQAFQVLFGQRLTNMLMYLSILGMNWIH